MPQEAITEAGLWFDDVDLASVAANVMTLEYGAELQDATLLADATRQRKPGLKIITFASEGFFNPDEADETLFEDLALQNLVTTVARKRTAGARAFLFRMTEGEYAPQGVVGEMYAYSMSGESSGGPLVRGELLHNATETVTGNSAGANLGAVAAAQKVYAALHVTADSPADTIDVVIESDADNTFATPTTRLTFPQLSAKGSGWQEVAGVIADTWWRATWTIGGTAPSWPIAISIGIL